MHDLRSGVAGSLQESWIKADFLLFEGAVSVDNSKLSADKVKKQAGPSENQTVFIKFYVQHN